MPTFVGCFLTVLMLTTFYSRTDARQQSTEKKVSPRMTADGIQAPLIIDGIALDGGKLHTSSGSTQRTEPTEIRWARYTLPGTTISLELPGEPYSPPAPPVSEVPDGLSFCHFGSNGLRMSVFMSYADTQATKDAREYALAALDVLTNNKRISDCKSTFDRSMAGLRVPVKFTCQADGVDAEMSGVVFFAKDRKRVFLVLGFFAKSDAAARASALRAVNSVALR